MQSSPQRRWSFRLCKGRAKILGFSKCAESHNMLLNKLTDHLTSVGYLCENNLLYGDININMLLPTNESTSLNYLVEAFGMTITKNLYPTRTTGNTATCLDLLFSGFGCNIHVQDYNLSDHSSVKLKMPDSVTMYTENAFRRRNWKKTLKRGVQTIFQLQIKHCP